MDKPNFAPLGQMVEFLRAQAGEVHVSHDGDGNSKPASGQTP